ncbi:universal stress protein [Streptomyces neyagawaensis]|uniref:universal stress protein n=1 Tax=Streptomyces neyagawaensis TaxID=42238 RepID=UPI0006E27F07|nr:universal stress protein [Streptomyces neyagawaensis]MCL6735972.1 universal stress protein [Streptomyces neyagawaensis]MDE1686890.1 universal stress protein [Streptomyces neyagawaensis]
MSSTVTVGLDGSDESLAAADWAAREAALRGLPLRLVHAGGQEPHAYVPFAGEPVPPPGADRSVSLLPEARARLAHRHPGLRVSTERLPGRTVPALVAAAEESELLVLGSRGLGRTDGVLLGSVALAVVARAGRPVVLVGSGEGEGRTRGADSAGDSAARAGLPRDVVVGLDLGAPDDLVLGFAFDAASRRAAALRVVHGWDARAARAAEADTKVASHRGRRGAEAPPGPAEVLRPWRDKYPGVQVTEEAVIGNAGAHLVDASCDAALVVVGRRGRAGHVGPRLGPITHHVVQHTASPVAVVPHD